MSGGALTKPESGAVAVRPGSLLETVLRSVARPDMPAAELREFLEIGKELEAREAKRQFAEAMVSLKPKLPVIAKRGQIMYKTGPGPKFSKWDDVYRECMPVLANHGFTCSFSSDLQSAGALKVSMLVRHIGGHEETGSLVVPWLDSGGSKSPAQQAASSFTLAQRHVFIKYFDVLTEDQDDDGSGKGTPEQITEQQAMDIEDIIHLCSDKDPKMKDSFPKWLKAEFQVDGIRSLFQGEQLEAVREQLKAKRKAMGI